MLTDPKCQAYQLQSARFPVHRDLGGFDFLQSKVARALVEQLAGGAFMDAVHNVMLVGGTGIRFLYTYP